MALRKTLLATTLLVLPTAGTVQAEPLSGLYLGAAAGVNFWHDQSSGGIRVHDHDTGLAVLGAVGWGFGNGLRVELEGNYRASEVDQLSVRIGGLGNSGSVRNYGAMVNALFDFDLSSFGLQPSAVTPYIGAGIGYGWYEVSGARFSAGGSSFQLDDSDGQFAYQGIAGAAISLSNLAPGLALTAEYRFYGTVDQSLKVSRVAGPPVAGVPGGVKYENVNHSILVGLRYNFGVTPPAPAPAPAAVPAPARTYMVFFDWDRADLTDRARQVIAEAAQASRQVQSTRIDVAGHADRSGPAPYNQRLSRRRAEVVAAELVSNGVNRSEIVVTAFGETRPLVPTADGVREPQNRRVEIVLN